jgi:predicted HAD superfamily Cof-like phosphohydrolase
MPDSFEVTSTALHEHARLVTALADELRRAFGHVSMAANAYGQVCEQVPPMLNAVSATAGQVVQAGIDALNAAATDIHASATTYTQNDKENAISTFAGDPR